MNQKFEILHEIVSRKFDLVGSRLILPDEVKATTDYDYIGVDNDLSRDWLDVIGFYKKKIKPEYMDDATTGVWERDGYPLQVCLKDPEYFVRVYAFWSEMKKKPEIFREFFWKSNPNGMVVQDAIRERVNIYFKTGSLLTSNTKRIP